MIFELGTEEMDIPFTHSSDLFFTLTKNVWYLQLFCDINFQCNGASSEEVVLSFIHLSFLQKDGNSGSSTLGTLQFLLLLRTT